LALKSIAKTVLGHRPAPVLRTGLDALERDWTFRRSQPDGVTAAVRVTILRGLTRAPKSMALVPITPKPRWIVYFVYLPDGELTAAHRFTLTRLRQADAGLCVICAMPTPANVPDELRRTADALYWKALPGFDFSAYALALHEIAHRSAGADMLVLNDSVFGPFEPIDTLWPAMHWRLTGFTASAQLQNHIQSYAFHLKNVDHRMVQTLRTVLPRRFAFDDYRGVVYGQESRFATVAARSMSVGALWYADGIRCGDPSILAALPLVRAGFPFLKRSLVTKNAHAAGYDEIRDTLRAFGHPVEGI
jgi:hypothetical protein